MCHLSPTVHLAWAVLTCGLLIFLIQHLWRYDQFKCLALSGGKQPGAFRRVMTYSYITSVPALAFFAVSMAVLKYRNGYMIPVHNGSQLMNLTSPNGAVEFQAVPTPFIYWRESDRVWLQPLYIIFGIVWALEIVTHLEELMFWIFLLHQGPVRRYWFASREYKTWAIGSCIAMAGLPLTAVLKRANPLKAEAYLFLIGSLFSFIITVAFFGVLARFPKLLQTVKKEGAAAPVILRLVNFHELNILRVVFRLFMTIPLIILGADGVRSHHVINEHQVWTDLLAFLAAVGTVISSAITLLIFFPRSLGEDTKWLPYSAETRSQYPSLASRQSCSTSRHHRSSSYMGNMSPSQTYTGRRAEISKSCGIIPGQSKKAGIIGEDTSMNFQSSEEHRLSFSPLPTPSYPEKAFSEDDYSLWNSVDYESQWSTSESDDKQPGGINYKRPDQFEYRLFSDIEMRLMDLRLIAIGQIIDRGTQHPNRPSRLHPYITSFTSPIDLPYEDEFAPRAI